MSSKASAYILQPSDKTLCPSCKTHVDMVATRSGKLDGRHPWFYVCWTCRAITQVGVGPVLREESTSVGVCTHPNVSDLEFDESELTVAIKATEGFCISAICTTCSRSVELDYATPRLTLAPGS